jgi:hypothetical protein
VYSFYRHEHVADTAEQERLVIHSDRRNSVLGRRQTTYRTSAVRLNIRSVKLLNALGRIAFHVSGPCRFQVPDCSRGTMHETSLFKRKRKDATAMILTHMKAYILLSKLTAVTSTFALSSGFLCL